MSQNTFVTLNEAAEILELNPMSLMGTHKNKYSPYKYKQDGNVTMFDIKSFLKNADMEESLTEKTKLLVEYLYHVEGISYTQIAKWVGVTISTIQLINFGYDKAYKICRWFCDNRPFHVKRFDEFYGWEHKWNRSPIKFKGCSNEKNN